MTRRKDPKPQQRTETETRVEPYKSLYNGISNGFQDMKINRGGEAVDGVILVESEDESPPTPNNNQVKWQQTDIDGIKIVSCVSMEQDLFQNQPAPYYNDDSDDESSSCTSSTFSSLSEESEEEEEENEVPTDSEENELPNLADFVDRSYVEEQIVSPSRLNVSMGHLLECCDIFEPNFIKIKKICESVSLNDLCSQFGESMRLGSKQCRVNLMRLPPCMTKSGGTLSEMVENDDAIKWLAASEVLTVGNLFSKLKLSWPRPKRVPPPKAPDPPCPRAKESSPERSPIKITLRRTSSVAGSDSEPGPYMVTAVGGTKKRGGGKRNFASKRTTVKRPRQPGALSLPPPQPSVTPSTASSFDEDSADSTSDTDDSDSDPDPDHILGCRSYEVENYNLNDILSLTIPFEDPGLFRSPRAASKAAQLKNKQTLAAVRSQTPQNRKIDEAAGNIRNIIRTMGLKSLSTSPEVQEPELPPKEEKKRVRRRTTKPTDEDAETVEFATEQIEKKVTKGAKRGPKPKYKQPEEPCNIDESSADSSLTTRDQDPADDDVVEVKKSSTKGAKRGPKPKRSSEPIPVDESSQDSTVTSRSLRRRLPRDEESLSSAPPSPIPDSGKRTTRRSTKSQDSETPLPAVNTRSTRSNTKVDLKDVPELEVTTRKLRKKIDKTEEEEKEETVEEEKEDYGSIDTANTNSTKKKIDLRDSIMRAIDFVIEKYAPPDDEENKVVVDEAEESPKSEVIEVEPSDSVDDTAKENSSVTDLVQKPEPEKDIENKDCEVVLENVEEIKVEKTAKTEKMDDSMKSEEIPDLRDASSKEEGEILDVKDTLSEKSENQLIKVNSDKTITETRMEVLRSLHKILEQQNQKDVSTLLPKRMLRDPRVRARLQREHEQVDRRTEESPRSPESEPSAAISSPQVFPSRIAKISPWPKTAHEPEATPPAAPPVAPDNEDHDSPSIIPPRPPTPPRVSSRSILLTPAPDEEAGPSSHGLPKSSELELDEDPIEDGEIRPKKKKKPEADQELTYKSPLEALESSTSKQSGYQRAPGFSKRPASVPKPRDSRRQSSDEDSQRALIPQPSTIPELSQKTPEPNHVPQNHSDFHQHQSKQFLSPPKPESETSVFHRRPGLLPTPPLAESEVFHRRPWNFSQPFSSQLPATRSQSSLSPSHQQNYDRGPPRSHHSQSDDPSRCGYPHQRSQPSFNQQRRPQSIVYEDDPGERYLEELRQMENGGVYNPYDRYYDRPRYEYNDYERVPTPPPPPRWRTPSPPPHQRYRYEAMMRHDRPRSRSRSPPRWKRRTPSPPPYRGSRRRTPSPYRRPHRY